MTFHNPALHAPPVAVETDSEAAVAARRRARIETATVSGWKRLVTPAGQVFVRSAAGPARLRLVPTSR